MRRYNILHGDTTTAGSGGVVIGSARNFTNMGLPLALVGDIVVCKTCGKDGHICARGPRLKETVDGRDVALDGDLCLCDCNPPPELINSRTDMCQEISTEEVVRQGYGAWVGIEPPKYDRVFTIKNNQTGQSLPHVRYRVTLPDGKCIDGVTDGLGMTQRITSARHQTVKIEIHL